MKQFFKKLFKRRDLDKEIEDSCNIRQLQEDAELGTLIAELGTGSGSSMFYLTGSFSQDHYWEAKWTTTISMEPYQEEEFLGHGQTSEDAVRMLIAKRKEIKI